MRLSTLLLLFCQLSFSQSIPLPEHPRPDLQRVAWINLNGTWNFRFDSLDQGLNEDWAAKATGYNLKIKVPFPWGSPLSGVANKADIAWYQKQITVPAAWQGGRPHLIIGASDYDTQVYIDGSLVGSFQGGYMPATFDLSDFVKFGKKHNLTIRVDDKRRDYALYGKQGYGDARGIWQTVYLENRGQVFVEKLKFTPDIDAGTVKVAFEANGNHKSNTKVNILITGPDNQKISTVETVINPDFEKIIKIPNQRLWSLSDPFLYQVKISLVGHDQVSSYFGMRKISVIDLPGTKFPYIALNNKPVYLQLALDQSYHPEGYYTFPTDAFMKEEIAKAKSIGLNGIRTHIKCEVPRKLYWADKLGLLVMADLPNFWGNPTPQAQAESSKCLAEMIERDFNHPSIFSWIVFNESWGLRTTTKSADGKETAAYLPETQKWVVEMYKYAKQLDPTRLVEDNSICCGAGHTETDILSWHEYLPGWEWENRLSTIEKNTYAGSQFFFEKGYTQGRQPNINSECGNVWGYTGSTGDVDISWDYHRMMNTFRAHPLFAGWLYTEHHDVINEWNGYWRFDRSNKDWGMTFGQNQMKVNDLHAPIYISTGNEISKTVTTNQKVKIPLWVSVYEENMAPYYQLNLSWSGTDIYGNEYTKALDNQKLKLSSWQNTQLDSLQVTAPNTPGLYHLSFILTDNTGKEIHHNVFHMQVKGETLQSKTTVIAQQPNTFIDANWSLKQWNILDNKKANGAGTGYFIYNFELTNTPKFEELAEAYFLVEASAKVLFDKDKSDMTTLKDLNYMLGAKASPHQNPNAYPMTDEVKTPSAIEVSFNKVLVKSLVLPDDPADHQGVLSWHNQPQDRKLREAGSYGYKIKIPISKDQYDMAVKSGQLQVKLATKPGQDTGIAVYGADFGRYPFGPSVVLKRK